MLNQNQRKRKILTKNPLLNRPYKEIAVTTRLNFADEICNQHYLGNADFQQ